MRRSLLALVLLASLVLGTGPAAAADGTGPRGNLVVSLTFDDGWRSQRAAAKALKARDMIGTFYVNSGQLGYPGFMSVKNLRRLEGRGHEVGGHTISHVRLTELPVSRAKYEVCSDRASLLKLGVRVTSFAYPYGDYDPAVKRIARECGYNSARAAWGLYDGRDRCDYCTNAEKIPVADPYVIRPVTAEPFIGKRALPNLKRAVRHAELAGGGWMPLLFHHICAPDCKDPGIALSDFEAFLDWLAAREPSTVVRSVDQVVSGPVRPAVGPAQWQVGGVPLVKVSKITPKERERILAQAKQKRWERAQAEDAAAKTAFTIPSIDVGQLEVIVVVCGTAALVVTLFRLGTRRRRYEW